MVTSFNGWYRVVPLARGTLYRPQVNERVVQ